MQSYLNIYIIEHYHDKFADLPAEKIKDKLKEDVSKMDKDGDSQITKEELKAWFVEQAEIGSSLEAKKLEGMTSFDQNDDNRLSWDEVFDDLKKLGNVENPTFKRGIELEKVRFKHADKDEDGLLNESEYGFYATPEYFSHMNNYTILSYINGEYKCYLLHVAAKFKNPNSSPSYMEQSCCWVIVPSEDCKKGAVL